MTLDDYAARPEGGISPEGRSAAARARAALDAGAELLAQSIPGGIVPPEYEPAPPPEPKKEEPNE